MKWWSYVLVCLLAVWLQLGFFGALRPLGVVPNLFLIVVIYSGLRLPASQAVTLAVAGGLMLDLASGADFGLRTAFYTTLALLMIVLKQMGADYDKPLLALAAIAGATLLYDGILLLNLVIGRAAMPAGVVGAKLIDELIANLALALLLRGLLRWWRRPISFLLLAGERR